HHSEVKAHRIQKSVGVEETFWENLLDEEEVFKQLEIISEDLDKRLSAKEIKGKSLTLKIKYKDFTVYTRSKTQEEYFGNEKNLFETAKKLWELRPFDKPVRLLGLSLSNLNTQEKKQVSVQLKIPFPELD